MGKSSQADKSFLNMAGEFLVAAELNRRGILSAVTYGASKSCDVWAFDTKSKRAVRVEVKTTGEGSKRWVIGTRPLVRQDWDEDLFWVLVLLPQAHPSTSQTTNEIRGQHTPRFFVLTSEEIWALICADDDQYRARYLVKHAKEYVGRAVLGVPINEGLSFENCWAKIKSRVS